MITLSEQDKIKINDLLNAIAEDEEIAKTLARAIGEDVEDFVDWVHNTEL